MKTHYWIILACIICVCGIAASVWFSSSTRTSSIEEVFFDTYTLSKEYGQLRIKTEQLLVQAKTYNTHTLWQADIRNVIRGWDTFMERSHMLESKAENISKQPFSFVPRAYAYDKTEISQIFDQAPAGRKIATLAKHLGVDAKLAMKILEQDQAQVTADAWNEAGDTFQKLETSATVIKDGAKVSVFVGTIVATGGTAGFISGSAISQASVVVSGADMILEVTDDAAKVGLGNHNKISSIISDTRKVTEPLSGLLAVADIPKNVTKGIEKLSAVTFGAEQLNSVAQDGKIIGIELPIAHKKEKFQNIKKYSAPVYITELKPEEASEWVKSHTEEKNSLDAKDEVSTALGIQGDVLETNDFENKEEEKEDLLNNKKQEESLLKISRQGVGDFVLSPKEEPLGNDWQGALRVKLFSHALIEIKDGVFDVSYSTPYTGGNFSGVGEIHLQGTYDAQRGLIQGTHYRKYTGMYKNENRTIVYSGKFSQNIPPQASEIKIQFNGSIDSTRPDGKGKPYTTTSEGGSSQMYELIVKK